MIEIALAGARAAGRAALIDDSDYELVARRPWWVNEEPSRGYGPYAVTDVKGARVGMHAFLTGWPLVDHINRDGLDNQRHNLRQATQAQNLANRCGNLASTSPFKGVSWCAPVRRWRARIHQGGREITLGTFASQEDAARAYDAAAIGLFGEFAYLNFSAPMRRRGP